MTASAVPESRSDQTTPDQPSPPAGRPAHDGPGPLAHRAGAVGVQAAPYLRVVLGQHRGGIELHPRR